MSKYGQINKKQKEYFVFVRIQEQKREKEEDEDDDQEARAFPIVNTKRFPMKKKTKTLKRNTRLSRGWRGGVRG